MKQKLLSLAFLLFVGLLFVSNCQSQEIVGLFSVGSGKFVEFAPGNLAEGGHSFVENQWSYGGYFCWGTGNNPDSISDSSTDFSVFYDWGKNMEGNWRTLTYAEWKYILHDRANANNLRALATVNGVHGMVLLPDNWIKPWCCSLSHLDKGWYTNIYDSFQWSQMEASGAVFLPAAGMRSGTVVFVVTSMGKYFGWYWSSTPEKEEVACNVDFDEARVATYGYSPRSFGFPVRLVRDKK